MKNRFFVMVYAQNKSHAEPMVDDNGETMFWGSYDHALDALADHIAIELGFEIFEMDA